ncbi:hypothetical protein D3C85_977590 [compost metagenome]
MASEVVPVVRNDDCACLSGGNDCGSSILMVSLHGGSTPLSRNLDSSSLRSDLMRGFCARADLAKPHSCAITERERAPRWVMLRKSGSVLLVTHAVNTAKLCSAICLPFDIAAPVGEGSWSYSLRSIVDVFSAPIPGRLFELSSREADRDCPRDRRASTCLFSNNSLPVRL